MRREAIAEYERAQAAATDTEARAELPDGPTDHARRLGLRAVSYLAQTVTIGKTRHALPRDLIALDGSSCVLWRPADREYDFDGWAPEHNGWFGGRYRTIGGAFNWLQRAIDARAGRAEDFRGC